MQQSSTTANIYRSLTATQPSLDILATQNTLNVLLQEKLDLSSLHGNYQAISQILNMNSTFIASAALPNLITQGQTRIIQGWTHCKNHGFYQQDESIRIVVDSLFESIQTTYTELARRYPPVNPLALQKAPTTTYRVTEPDDQQMPDVTAYPNNNNMPNTGSQTISGVYGGQGVNAKQYSAKNPAQKVDNVVSPAKVDLDQRQNYSSPSFTSGQNG